MYYPNLCAFLVAVLVGCRLHAPGSENSFDMGSSGARKFWARDTKLGRWVELDMMYLAPNDLMGWSAVCTCSACASVLYLLFFYRPYRPNEGHRRSQTCRSHVYLPYLCAFLVAVLVGCRLHALGPKNFIREGSSGSRKFWASNTKFGTLMEFNVRNSMVRCIWWGA